MKEAGAAPMALEGLTDAEAERRLQIHGPNVLPEPPAPSIFQRVVHELTNAFTLLLLAAAVVSLLLRETIEGLAIAAIVALNTIIATVQTERAESAMAALRSMAAPLARARRGGEVRVIPADRLVPGDVVELAAGDRVPADVRLVEAAGLGIDEALLTGESLPVDKLAGAEAPEGAGPADRPGDAFAATLVVRGRGLGVVSATGADTEVGRLAGLLQERPEAPLEREVRDASGKVALAAIAVGALLPALAWIRDGTEGLIDGVLAGVALAVAAVPEGLLTVVTTSLAIGGQRMARRGAIVRQLSAIEALGAMSVLCVDKTGTLTEASLEVEEEYPLASRERELWRCALLCNDSDGASGDPIDLALVRAGEERGYERPPLPRIAEEPFSSETRMMTTVHEVPGEGQIVLVKGAPEAVLSRCPPGDDREDVREAVRRLTAGGLRVLAFAQGEGRDAGELMPLGAIGFADPLRPSTVPAVRELRGAGIRLVMVTGDHLATARAVAAKAGLPVGPAVSGHELATLDEREREEILAEASVVARVEPGTKLDLVRGHQEAGHVVGMTGDGVNDAPALRAANVGVAVAGQQGTDVAREAASVVVTDANLATISAAVREGRLIFRNLVNAIAYLLTGNVSEVVVVLAGLLLLPGLAVPLLPVQLLWINLITDGLPAIAVALDQERGDLMSQPPRAAHVRLLTWQRQAELALRGTMIGVVVLATGVVARERGWTEEEVRGQLLLSVLAAHLVLAYIIRSSAFTFERGWADNRVLLAAVGGSLALQVAVLNIPLTRDALGVPALPALAWGLALGAAAAVVVAADLARLVRRRFGRPAEGVQVPV